MKSARTGWRSPSNLSPKICRWVMLEAMRGMEVMRAEVLSQPVQRRRRVRRLDRAPKKRNEMKAGEIVLPGCRVQKNSQTRVEGVKTRPKALTNRVSSVRQSPSGPGVVVDESSAISGGKSVPSSSKILTSFKNGINPRSQRSRRGKLAHLEGSGVATSFPRPKLHPDEDASACPKCSR